MLSLDMEVSFFDGFLYIILFWIISKIYRKLYKYWKSQGDSVSKELYSVVCNGNIQALKLLLSSTNVDINTRIGRDRNTLLHYASSAEVTRELLLHGAYVDAVNDDGMTPLFFTVIDNKGPTVIQELLNHGADPNLRSNDGHIALHFIPCLTDRRGLAVVRHLIQYGAEVNAADSDGATPLFFAVMCETNLDIIKELLLNGADINVRGRYPFTTRYFTPLDLAIDEEKLPYAKLVIKITLLKNFEGDFRKIIDLDSYSGSMDYRELSNYLESCIVEINLMKNHKINCNLTLYDFVSKISDSEMVKPLYASKTITENEMLTNYSLYHDVFWPNMKLCLERADLLNKLSKLQVFAGSGSPIRDVKEKEVILNHDCMYKIGEYLSNDDLLNFLSGFEKVLNRLSIFRTNLWNISLQMSN